MKKFIVLFAIGLFSIACATEVRKVEKALQKASDVVSDACIDYQALLNSIGAGVIVVADDAEPITQLTLDLANDLCAASRAVQGND